MNSLLKILEALRILGTVNFILDALKLEILIFEEIIPLILAHSINDIEQKFKGINSIIG